jgi:hypothetical protein
MNSAIYTLYSLPNSIYQYRQHLNIKPDVLFGCVRENHKDDSIYIDIPDIPEIIILSDIDIKFAKYEIIIDKRIVRNVCSILVKKYKNVVIRVYDVEDYEKMEISFNITLAKKSIRSCL